MKIILFDDHELFAKSLEIALSAEFDNFSNYNPTVDILDTVVTEKPDIILMDIHMGNKNGLEEGRKILEAIPNARLIFLSGYSLSQYHEEAIKMGAKAFISKSCSIPELITKIKLVDSGNTIFPEYKQMTEKLTVREIEVLRYIAKGLNQQEIADQLFTSRRTISTHVQHILEKMSVNSTVSAIVRGIELGVIHVDL